MLSVTTHGEIINVLFNLFVIVVDDVDLMMCISGHLADESTIPKILSPVGSGTYKSMWTFSQGFCMIVACKSLRLPSFELLKQGMHDQISFPVSLSRPGHHILLCNNDFVLIMPWCPLWAISEVFSHKQCGMTILISFKMIPEFGVNLVFFILK